MQPAMPASSAAQLGEVGGGVAFELAALARLGGGSAALDLGHRSLGVARVVPPVRVIARGLRPARLAGQALGHDRAEIDDFGVAAAVGDDLVDPRSSSSPFAKTSFASAAPSTSLGRGSYSCGSVLGCEDLVDRDGVATDLADEVAELGGGGDDLELAAVAAPSRAAAGAPGRDRDAATASAARRARVPAPGPAPRRRRRRRRRTAIVAPGGASVSTESQRPTVPSTATRATLASCQLGIRRVKSRAVAAGTTNSAVTSSAPTDGGAAVAASAIRPSSATSSHAGASPWRRRRRVEAEAPASAGRAAARPQVATCRHRRRGPCRRRRPAAGCRTAVSRRWRPNRRRRWRGSCQRQAQPTSTIATTLS